MDARLNTSDPAINAFDLMMRALAPLSALDRNRALLLVVLDMGPNFLSDEALLRLCHAAQREAPSLPPL